MLHSTTQVCSELKKKGSRQRTIQWAVATTHNFYSIFFFFFSNTENTAYVYRAFMRVHPKFSYLIPNYVP